MYRYFSTAILSLFFAYTSAAQQTPQLDTLTAKEIPSVVIIAQKDALITQVCGAAHYINQAQITRIAPINGNEVLRSIPGLHVVDEEGAGLRANVGIRGLDPDRGAATLVLEDGIPVQLNPYGEPELYYTPSMERMSGVEVVKGSGQIKYGPRTIGGVVNYISKPIPAQRETQLEVAGGLGGYFKGRVAHGNRFGQSGYLIDYLHKRADRIGVIGYEVHDALFKAQHATGANSNLTLKAQLYRETSNATYVGLTQAMFDQGDYYPNLAPNDQLRVQRTSLSLAHRAQVRKNFRITSQVYHYQTSRDWRRQDFSYDRAAPNRSALSFGDTTQSTGAIYLLNSAAWRNRAFEVTGLESQAQWQYTTGKIAHEMEFGARLIAEKAQEVQLNTTKPDSQSGILALHEERPGSAVSAFVQQRSTVGRFDMTIGLRAERYSFERGILLAKNSANVLRDTFIGAGTTTQVLIPGAGVRYLPNAHWVVFAGVHKGFAPAGIKQAITNTGAATQLDPQSSWNAELGVRAQPVAGLLMEATAFYLDFDRQVIPVSESSGQAGAGFVNAGATLHRGIEAALSYDWQHIGNTDHALGVRSSVTYTRATFSSDRFVGTDLRNINGLALPYAPRWVSNTTLHYTAPAGVEVSATYHTTSGQYADVLNTTAPNANGRTGYIPAFGIMDAQVAVPVKRWKSTFSVAGKNLTNERYIASRRPQGIKVGTPLMVVAGWRWAF